MKAKPLPSTPQLQDCFSYDPLTGAFTWRRRPDTHFVDASRAKQWNSRFAYRPAFITLNNKGRRTALLHLGGVKYRLLASRVAFKLMTGEEPNMVDHENTDHTDDRFCNLRAATRTQNAANNNGRRGRVFPKGVSYEKGRFRAAITGPKQRAVNLGVFDTPAAAHDAYCAAGKVRYGEFFNPGIDRPSIFN